MILYKTIYKNQVILNEKIPQSMRDICGKGSENMLFGIVSIDICL